MAPDFPVVYLLSTRLDPDKLHELEAKIPTLTYDVNEADVVVGNIAKKERALFELRRLKLLTDEVIPDRETHASPRVKRRRITDSSEDPMYTDSTVTSDDDGYSLISSRHSTPSVDRKRGRGSTAGTVKVVKLAWLTDSLAKGTVLPLDDYLIYAGRKKTATTAMPPPPKPADILKRAQADAGEGTDHYLRHGPFRHDGDGGHHRAAMIKPPALLHQTTSEHDIVELLPPIPDYLRMPYACQRPAPMNPPNAAFIEKLKKIRTTRTLVGDKIGVRAYSSSIAALTAYPYTLQSAQEVARLPGCGVKVAELYQEFKETGQLKEVKDAEEDSKLSVLRLFYEIWGVAETTAKDFYNRGWRDLDDIVEYGWNSLTRVQQIGVKYYDEFEIKIPRREVEAIANIVLDHANKIRKGFQMVVVGGYRRGKELSGDVDMILSHPEESATRNFVENIVLSLEKDKYITHTLILSNKNSERGQVPVAWKGNEKKSGTGFDTLDKALVVWQDPNWTPEEGVIKNPNLHRRVDIIISPWKTTGCAVLGWTSGTTFQRDLRRYCKAERGLKFDSSGVRSRIDGSWVDLEDGGRGKAPDMLTAERRVFEGLGLKWIPPEERNTG
ncbi:Nucleotidyltransferase [Pleurostoma richardsiae]|uniref:DNA polymerase n=1 Tax=Pleurostoma richardsiae TaxID=41990 RepID=A0AA38RCI1_9PEZI|nr:Nucleotidyltransferase [Pleurostoma richardsiae]